MCPEEAYSSNLELKLNKIADAIESSQNAYDGQGSIITYPQVLALKTKKANYRLKKQAWRFKELYELLIRSLFLCSICRWIDHTSSLWNALVENTGLTIQLIGVKANQLKKLFDDNSKFKNRRIRIEEEL